MPSVSFSANAAYRGRLAPTPTGLLHLGHALTFWTAQERARQHGGTLILRNEDLDPDRCKPQFTEAMMEDLRWFGFQWQEGPDVGGPYAPYVQSQRRQHYLDAWRSLLERGVIYPCQCSRKDLAQIARAPHEGGEDDEPVYPGSCRRKDDTLDWTKEWLERGAPDGVNWRFRVTDGETLTFTDRNPAIGLRSFRAGCDPVHSDFGDFLVWRRDGVPSYQLAVVVDDAAMGITEVVRGEDLLKSTARQILLQRALGYVQPTYFHCPLVRDESGLRLAKRHDALSLRAMREQGLTPEEILKQQAGPR